MAFQRKNLKTGMVVLTTMGKFATVVIDSRGMKENSYLLGKGFKIFLLEYTEDLKYNVWHGERYDIMQVIEPTEFKDYQKAFNFEYDFQGRILFERPQTIDIKTAQDIIHQKLGTSFDIEIKEVYSSSFFVVKIFHI